MGSAMNAVNAFVHLYHVWGALGAITACLFGREAYRGWREAGGTWASAPGEWFYTLRWVSGETARDIARFASGALRGFLGIPFNWAETQWKGRIYPRRQVILIGITLGGTSRLLTALYWAERNREWMAHVDGTVIAFASAVILPAVIGDLFHHYTAWPEKRHRARMIMLAGCIWVLIGALTEI